MNHRINPKGGNRRLLSAKVILFTSLVHYFPLALNTITIPTINILYKLLPISAKPQFYDLEKDDPSPVTLIQL